MRENKKYWYIQLNVNFFDDERIDWLSEQTNGYAYVVLYLKLCLKTANNSGILTRQIGDMIIPYNIEKIAEITHMNVDIVRVALELYKKIGLVYEADENFNFMRLPEVPKMVGYTTSEAIRKAEYRRKKALEVGQIEDNKRDNVPQELRVKSLELRDDNKKIKDKSKKEDEAQAEPALDAFTVKSKEVLEYLNEKAGKRYKAVDRNLKHIKARLREGFTEDDCKSVIDKKCAEWAKNERMNQYLRCETLFGGKFESYLNQNGQDTPEEKGFWDVSPEENSNFSLW